MASTSNLRKKDVNNMLEKAFIKITKTDYTNENTINLGYILPIECSMFVVRLMDQWVHTIDLKLEKLEEYSDEYAAWFGIRSFSYSEFRLVMETKISEEKIERSKVYDYLYLDDAISVEKFKIKYGGEEKKIRESYLLALRDTLEFEVPILYQFLCREKKIIKHPINNLLRHTYMLAQSSMGKSEFIKHLIYELLVSEKNVKSIILLEPHFDLCKDVLRFVPNQAFENVIYLDPEIQSTAVAIGNEDADLPEMTFSINPFDIELKSKRDLNFLTEHLSKALFSIIDSEETFQMMAIIEAAVETLLLREKSDIRDLKRFMNNDENEDLIAFAIQNLKGERQKLMHHKFERDPKIQQTKSSVYYRLQSLLGKPQVVQVLSGPATVDVRTCMESGKLIICNFNKGSLGPDGAVAVGKLMTSLISGFAMLRDKQTKRERVPTYIFLDEFQNYIHPGTTETLMAEQRKYACYMFLSNQQMGQNMSAEMRRLISGNTAVKLMGENEPESITWMSNQMKGLDEKSNFDLPLYSFYFYDKYKKDLGSFILRSPSYLLDENSKFYLDKNQTRSLIKYLAFESGIYREVKDSNEDLDNFVFDNNFSD